MYDIVHIYYFYFYFMHKEGIHTVLYCTVEIKLPIICLKTASLHETPNVGTPTHFSLHYRSYM